MSETLSIPAVEVLGAAIVAHKPEGVGDVDWSSSLAKQKVLVVCIGQADVVYPPTDAADPYVLVGLLFAVLEKQGRKPVINAKVDDGPLVLFGEVVRDREQGGPLWLLLARAVVAP